MYLFKILFLFPLERSGNAGSYGRSILIFLRKFCIVFHNDWTNLHSYQQCIRIPFLLYPHQHLSSLVFVMIVILTGVRRYLIVVLICISLMISVIEHLFRCVLTTMMSSLEKSLFSSSDF